MFGFTTSLENCFKEFSDYSQKLNEGLETLSSLDNVDLATAEKEVVYTDGKLKLYRYKSLVKKVCSVPVLITYALVNRNTMLDLQENRSLIRNLLHQGMDLYLIDWGYPERSDRYLTMEDHIDGYMNDCVDFMRKQHQLEKINLLGVCQGGTFSCIYTSLYPEKINTLVATVTPVDFDHEKSLLNVWCQGIDADLMVDTMGNVPGDMMNLGFQMLKPFSLNFQKYVDMVDIMKDKEKLEDFIRMETWIFDSPDQAGETFRKFLKDLYQKNLLIKGELRMGSRRVDLKKIDMPLLMIYAEKDHLVPPEAVLPLYEAVSSKDKEKLSFPVGHIGLYVSGKTQKVLAPSIATWINNRS
ncbi:MAG: class III poly(R)-hydroxyalkanoic acid synthase subunit PhaC [SAR324 cluster bacterium]|uniref:Poly(3-hydroxyalkanoate) polymerase subunit PhaC n=1 Tax=SAR324 cluster bacterium TaxID=2024889 RepID=A0A2A4T9I3_9DELT|nr:MAG: class III poly(R)-hydroxyalkanoic acid synthase subunit PhaC [SAR324 cluster bacterium]